MTTSMQAVCQSPRTQTMKKNEVWEDTGLFYKHQNQNASLHFVLQKKLVFFFNVDKQQVLDQRPIKRLQSCWLKVISQDLKWRWASETLRYKGLDISSRDGKPQTCTQAGPGSVQRNRSLGQRLENSSDRKRGSNNSEVREAKQHLVLSTSDLNRRQWQRSTCQTQLAPPHD